MAVVTSVSDMPVDGHDGQLGDSNDNFVKSYVNEESTSIPFGIGVVQGTNSDDCAYGDAATDVLKFLGVTVHSSGYENGSLAGDLAIAANTVCSVVRRGTVWVDVEETVVPTDDVFMRFTSDGASNTQLGKFRNDCDTGRAVKLRGAKFLVGGTSTTPALLYLSGNEAASPAKQLIPFSHLANSDGGAVTTALIETPADSYLLIDEVSYVNPTGLAAHDDNHTLIQIKSGSTVHAGWNTDGNGTTDGIGATASAEGTLTGGTWVSLTNNTLANRTVAPATAVNVLVSESGTTTVPAGLGNLTCRVL